MVHRPAMGKGARKNRQAEFPPPREGREAIVVGIVWEG
jgi:hypothetical protein